MSNTAMQVKQNTRKAPTHTQNNNKVVIYNQLDKPEVRNNLVKLFRNEQKANRFIAEARINLSTNPELADCSPESFVRAALQTAQLNLSINPLIGEAYLMPRWNGDKGCKEATFQLGYKAYLNMARKTKEVLDVDGAIVRKGDTFSHSYTEEIDEKGKFTYIVQPLEHETSDEHGDIIGAYAKAIIKNDNVIIKKHIYMTVAQLEAHMKKYATKNKKGEVVGLAVKDFEAWALKTVLGRLSKKLPLTTEDKTAIELQEEYRQPDEVNEYIDAEIQETVPEATEIEPEHPQQEAQQEEIPV